MASPIDSQLQISAEEQAQRVALIKRMDAWATNMDTRFRIPFTPFRFGLDPIVGLIPGLGDAAGLLLSAYILWHAARYKLPPRKMARMVSNMGVEFVIGILPVVGNLFDVYWRANVKNVDVLRAHLLPEAASRERQRKRGLRLRQLGLFAFFVASLGIIVYVVQSDRRLFDYRTWFSGEENGVPAVPQQQIDSQPAPQDLGMTIKAIASYPEMSHQHTNMTVARCSAISWSKGGTLDAFKLPCSGFGDKRYRSRPDMVAVFMSRVGPEKSA